MRPTVIVLTFNSEATLAATLSSARQVSDEIFVVDSYSSDGTIELARSLGAAVVQHEFEHYGAQRNWAIDHLPVSRPWQLHLDADECMDSRLVSAIRELPDEPEHAAYFIARYVRFLGRVMRHGAMSPTWHMRLFRRGSGRCENRQYDQHFLLASGTSGKLPGEMIDDNRMSLTEWTARHNRWADYEAAELDSAAAPDRLKPDARGNPAQRKRFLRGYYYRMPLFFRAFAFFVYRYFFRLGILDGTEGAIYWVLQTLWFRFLVDAKIWERRNAARLAQPSAAKMGP